MRIQPRIIIGLPVYNGQDYLEKALDSILAQTYTDFDVIISDNASTDRTEEICRGYASKDSRVRYYRSETNLGVSRNFNRVFELSSSEYFKWAAHDDVLAPESIARCIEVLDKDQSIVLCHSKTGRIDEHGQGTGTYKSVERVESRKRHERFGHLLGMDHEIWAIFGAIRSSALRMTPLLSVYVGSDRNLLAEIGLIGRIHETPEVLFYRRDHPEASTRLYKKHEDRLAHYSPHKAGQIRLPYWRRCREYFRSVGRVQMGRMERLLCYVEIWKWVRREGWRLMGSDVERSFLSGSAPARKFAAAVKWILRRTLIPITGREM